MYRGAVFIDSARSQLHKMELSSGLRQRIEEGIVCVNPAYAREEEDEVHILAGKTIELRMMEENPGGEENNQSLWIVEPVSKINRFRRMFMFKDKMI